mgnify:FL=1
MRTAEVDYLQSNVIKRTTLKMQVYEHLKDQIINGAFKPGERLIEEKIAESLNVSRSPVREAIRLLEKDGLVIVKRSGGVQVVNPTMDDFKYLFEYRKEVESATAYYAAQRRTGKHIAKMQQHIETMNAIDPNDSKTIHQSARVFHATIAEASENPFFVYSLSRLQGINTFYRSTIVFRNKSFIQKAVAEHEEIFEAIKNQNDNLAKQLMREHIENDYERYLSLLEQRE